MANAHTHLFIINPAAGKRDSSDFAGRISSFCSSKGVGFEIRLTRAPGDAANIASEGLAKGFSHIISVGGDGTSSEIAGVIAGTEARLGVIAAGSGNDFRAACGLPLSFGDALEAVVSGGCIKVDTGLLDGRKFINGLGIGMDGAIASRFPQYRFLGGFAGYLAAACAEAFSFDGFEALLSLEGSKTSGRCILAGVSNGHSQGGFKISPAARPGDGLLDFHFVKDMSAPVRLIRLASVIAGKADGEWIMRIQSDAATIETEKDLPAHIDGEPFILQAGRHEISIHKGALNLLCPQGAIS